MVMTQIYKQKKIIITKRNLIQMSFKTLTLLRKILMTQVMLQKKSKSKKLEKIAKLKEKIKMQLNAIEEIEIRITKEQEQVDTLKEALEKVL